MMGPQVIIMASSPTGIGFPGEVPGTVEVSVEVSKHPEVGTAMMRVDISVVVEVVLKLKIAGLSFQKAVVVVMMIG